MKFSMAIIEEYLRKYHPVSNISSTEPTIVGVKMFSYEKEPDPDYLYVGHNNDFFYGGQSREVLLVHRKDVISLSTYELEDVFNDIIECIQFYNSWEQKILSAYHSPNPEQSIIDACAEIFGPMFFTTMSLQITAISSQYPKGSINPNWDDFLESGTLSLVRFQKIKEGKFMEYHNQVWDCGVFYEENVERFRHSIMVSQVNNSGKLTGQMTIISDEPFKDYQKHLIPPLKNALCLVANILMDGDRGTIAQSVFLDLIHGGRKDLAVPKFYDLMGWNRSQTCLVAVLRNPNALAVSFGYDVDMLKKEFPKALFCVNDEKETRKEIVCCIPVDAEENQTGWKKFSDFVEKLDFHYGVSYPFPGVENLDIQYQQACAAVERDVRFFYYCAMPELLSLLQTPAFRQAAIHPAINKIREYDESKKTDYFHMLAVYLHNERDRVRSAEELFIHKNTLVYRLKKMESLFDIRFDNVYDREYLLISVNCVESMR